MGKKFAEVILSGGIEQIKRKKNGSRGIVVGSSAKRAIEFNFETFVPTNWFEMTNLNLY